MSKQPAALHYAEVLENFYLGLGRMDATGAAAELRRLQALNDELLEVLQTIMAGVAGCERQPHWEAARAAIAKAEGQA